MISIIEGLKEFEKKHNVKLTPSKTGALIGGIGALNIYNAVKLRKLRKSIEDGVNEGSELHEYEIFQFTKRGYTSRYPGFSIPSTLSTPSMKKIVKHLSAVISARLSQKDKDADKFDGRNANYDEKVSLQKE